MQKWEYLFLTVFRVGDVWKVGIVNGKEIPKWIQGVSLYDFVNERGEEGWELISANFSPSSPILPTWILRITAW